MMTSRTHMSRQIDYAALANGQGQLRYMIVRFVRGIQGRRENPVTTQLILDWFRGTPKPLVSEELNEAIGLGYIRPCQNSLRNGRNNSAIRTYYEVTDLGLEYLFPKS